MGERHLTQPGHLAAPHLVQDLAGLGIRPRIEGPCLVGGQKRSTPRAISGASQSVNRAVMMASRPKTVLNQGMPA